MTNPFRDPVVSYYYLIWEVLGVWWSESDSHFRINLKFNTWEYFKFTYFRGNLPKILGQLTQQISSRLLCCYRWCEILYSVVFWLGKRKDLHWMTGLCNCSHSDPIKWLLSHPKTQKVAATSSPLMSAVRTSLESILTSSSIDWIDLLLSLPLVNGTIQKLHIFSHPLMIDLTQWWLNDICPTLSVWYIQWILHYLGPPLSGISIIQYAWRIFARH